MWDSGCCCVVVSVVAALLVLLFVLVVVFADLAADGACCSGRCSCCCSRCCFCCRCFFSKRRIVRSPQWAEFPITLPSTSQKKKWTVQAKSNCSIFAFFHFSAAARRFNKIQNSKFTGNSTFSTFEPLERQVAVLSSLMLKLVPARTRSRCVSCSR